MKNCGKKRKIFDFFYHFFAKSVFCFILRQKLRTNRLETIFILIIAGWFEKNEIAMNGKQRLWVLAISFGIILLVFTAMYISWSIVGSQIISGVQGRYFIPTAILILLCLSLKNNYLKIRHIKTIFMCSMILINIIAIKSIIQFF